MATVTQNDPQAEVNKDDKKVPDASEAARSRGAEKGDVDVVKAQEDKAKDDDARIEDAHKAKADAVKESESEAKKRDKAQEAALKVAADAKNQPHPEVRRSLADVRDGVDLVNKEWTAQSSGSYLAPQSEVGQAFVKAQLPDRKVQKAAGIDPDQQTAGLVVLDDDNATKDVISGPEPWEARDLGLVKN